MPAPPGPVNPNALTAANTGSTLAYNTGVNKTSTAISTNIIIYVNNTAVGAVQQLSVNEKRTIKMVDEIGTDGHIDSVPTQSTNITGSCQRIRFDSLRVAEAFSRGFIHVSAQVYPFDIVILDRSKSATADRITTVIKNVWITGIDVTYNADNWIITETMSWEAETIFSITGGSTDPNAGGSAAQSAAKGGERGIQHAIFSNPIPNIEQAADTGSAGRRGALDAGGLIDMLNPDGSGAF